MSDRPLLVVESIKATPSVGAIVISWLNVPLSEWSLRLGVLFLCMQIGHFVFCRWREWRGRKKGM